MTGTCIYCGQAETTRKGDHVPPQCLFGEARGHPLIQVPCCHPCNQAIARDDERVRNLLSSTENVEAHSLTEELKEKRDRSLVREMSNGRVSRSNLYHLAESSNIKPRFSEGGIYLGHALALNFNQDCVKRFLERMIRALHHNTYNTGYINCEVTWSNIVTDEMQEIFDAYRPSSHGTLGDDVFFYAEYTPDPDQLSFWFMRFLGGAEFWAGLLIVDAEKE